MSMGTCHARRGKAVSMYTTMKMFYVHMQLSARRRTSAQIHVRRRRERE